jgi:hypothetical protein
MPKKRNCKRRVRFDYWKNEFTVMVFETFAEFNEIIACSLFLILCTAVSVHICVGYGTKSAKETMIWSLIILLAAVQLYHLIDAALYVPATKFYIYKV